MRYRTMGHRSAEWSALALVLTVALTACGSSGTSTPGGGDGGPSTGSTSGGCTYELGAPTCETYTGTASEVNGKIGACMRVFGGTAVAACPTTGIVGKCKVVPDSPQETDEIFYYEGDAGILTYADLCDSANGTYTPAM